jgi:hypothetical protein
MMGQLRQPSTRRRGGVWAKKRRPVRWKRQWAPELNKRYTLQYTTLEVDRNWVCFSVVFLYDFVSFLCQFRWMFLAINVPMIWKCGILLFYLRATYTMGHSFQATFRRGPRLFWPLNFPKIFLSAAVPDWPWCQNDDPGLTQLTTGENADAGLTFSRHSGIHLRFYDIITSSLWKFRVYSYPPPAVWTCRMSFHH